MKMSFLGEDLSAGGRLVSLPSTDSKRRTRGLLKLRFNVVIVLRVKYLYKLIFTVLS